MASRLDQSVDARLREIADVFESHKGLTGKAKRDASGVVVGRFRGSMSAYPELRHVQSQPAAIAKAIRRGRGVVYRRVRLEVTRDLAQYVPKERQRYPQRPTVAPHERLTAKCTLCGTFHGKGEHRFHGEGAFHQTHLFGFNPPMPTKIYDQVLSVVAKKGPGHRCSPACKRANHTYIHRFKTRPPMTGSADRQTLMIGKPIGAPARRNPPRRQVSCGAPSKRTRKITWDTVTGAIVDPRQKESFPGRFMTGLARWDGDEWVPVERRRKR